MSADNRSRNINEAIAIGIIGLVFISLIVILAQHTSERIHQNKQSRTLKILNNILPLEHTNQVLSDTVFVSELNSTLYRFRDERGPVGAVYLPVSASGYNAGIKLAVGVTYDGVLTGVRILAHRETPGLGDQIHQNKSDWIRGFMGRSLDNTAHSQWAVSSDGGNFDQLSGATISPRGVIRAVKNVLEHHQSNKEYLYK